VNDRIDRLEAELAGLRPHDASPQLRERIADHLARSRPPVLLWPWGLALGGGLAAAVFALIVFPWSVKTPDEAKLPVVRAKLDQPADVEAPSPTLLTYQRALAQSSEALDIRLDKDALLPLGAGPRFEQISAFTRSDAALNALLGEN
jgi:hypothetical protein